MSKSSRSHRYSLPLAISLFALSMVSTFFLQSRKKIRKYRKELEKQIKLRQDERTGRINVEKKRREEQKEVTVMKGYNLSPIGVIDSPFPDRRATPRQPILAPAARALIRFNKQLIQYKHYEELSQFSHIWVIFIFHENTSATEKASLPAKIAPPRLSGQRVGCLSTRSPHRPNPIGLSVCEIVEVTDQYIEIRGVDFVNGTPVLDVKPYIPYDIIPSNHLLPMVTDSTGAPLPLRSLTVPSWVVESDIPLLPVHLSATAQLSLQEIIDQKMLKFYESYDKVREFISQILRQDIRGIHQGRGKEKKDSQDEGDADENGGSSYICRLDNLRIGFSSNEEGIVVDSIVFNENLKTVSHPRL